MRFTLLAVLAPHRTPTRWGPHLLFALGTVLVLAVIYALMALGWRHRKARSADVPAPEPLPADRGLLGRRLLAGRPVLLLGATSAGDWLDRVNVHGLGQRSHAVVSVFEAGVVVDPDHRDPFLLPAETLREARADNAHAGKVMAGDRLAVLSADLGPRTLDIGLRPDDSADLDPLLAAVGYLIAGTSVDAGHS